MAADFGAATCPAPQPAQHLAALVMLRSEASAQDDHGQDAAGGRLAGREAAVDLDGDAVAGGHRRAVAGDQAPTVKSLPGKPVGNPQRFDGARERHHREVGDQQEEDGLARAVDRTLSHRLVRQRASFGNLQPATLSPYHDVIADDSNLHLCRPTVTEYASVT